MFSAVRIQPAGQLDAQGNLPITVDVTERKLHSVDMGVAYSTDLGVNVNAGWHHRNLFGNAEQLNLTGAVNLGGSAVTKPGYRFSAQFIKPDFLARDQQLELDFIALDQSLKAYDQVGVIEQATLNRKFSPHWSGSVGLLGEQEKITQEGVSTHYNLFGVPIVARYDSTNNQFDPTEGIRASAGITPTQSFGSQNATFFVMQASGSTYFDLSGERAQRRRAAGAGGQDRRRRRVQPAAGSALLCRRQLHGARLPLPIDRAAVPGQQPDRRHRDLRWNSRVPPAHSRQLRRGRVRRCRPGHRQRRAVHQQLARRRRRGLPLLHLDRADPCRHRRAAEQAARRRCVRACTSGSGRRSECAAPRSGWPGFSRSLIGVPVVLLVLVIVGANLEPGRNLLVKLVPSLTGGQVAIAGLGGRFPDALRVATVELRDTKGAYLTLHDVVLDWSPLRLAERVLDIERADRGSGSVARQPEPSSSNSSSSGLPVRLVVHQLQVGRLELAPAVVGAPYALALDGAGRLEFVYRRPRASLPSPAWTRREATSWTPMSMRPG